MNKLKKMFKGGDDDSADQTSSYSSSTPTQRAPAAVPAQQYSTQQPPMQQSSMQQPPMQQSSMQQSSMQQPSMGGEIPDGVILHTTLGDITIALYKDQTPRTCKNFAELARTGQYDNVIFHRIIPGFMIQGGDPTGTGRGGSSIYGAKFEDEFVPSLRHEDKGTMSMANSGPGTNGSQFFITLGPTPHLNGKHTVFGHVAQGMDVVDRLGSVRTGAGDRPMQEVRIESCDVI
ncbi:heme binding [Friedmanniomyces endolithicus]|uniref:Peptidyl-prolyl cis-trans isomerase n=1 Tax=Rachicladosporium monterosium TaxID=1507873 RepID=A0ABR0LA72_9PEZI|nr:heme binding [Friedmanniomyces endolithicus]KAK1079558.1 heme binding [Friedmanniomyces endolithicus]KAK1087324.1 heme binding [Friedmanniomyces endolithicus]KAK1823270.1 heme binding [Friedmanniomyces endolithicus]KAK5145857.1 heme binding [Rachicladosporium monterosium]